MLKRFWEQQQEGYTHSQETRYITGSKQKAIWDFLDIQNKLEQEQLKVLNIGVGTGRDTKELFERNIDVSVLDISPLALKRVESYTTKRYLSEKIKELPNDCFDIAVSHLVTQHLSDGDLIIQMKHVLGSLKTDGLFVIQFAWSKDVNDKSLISQKEGECSRDVEHMTTLIHKTGGIVIKQVPFVVYKDIVWAGKKRDVYWYGLHVQKDIKYTSELRMLYNKIYEQVDRYGEKPSDIFCQIKELCIDNFLYNFQGGKVLDAGCGKGVELKRLFNKGYNVLGIDISDYCCNAYLKELPSECIDIESFCKQQDKYDAVICLDVLEHVQEEYVETILQSLKSITNKIIFGIANHSDKQMGCELHKTLKNKKYWVGVISKYFKNIINTVDINDIFYLIQASQEPPSDKTDFVISDSVKKRRSRKKLRLNHT